MDERVKLIMLFAATAMFAHGVIVQRYALARYRASDEIGPWLGWNPKNWREQRAWFSSEYGYRLYRWAGWHTLLGGLLMAGCWFF